MHSRVYAVFLNLYHRRGSAEGMKKAITRIDSDQARFEEASGADANAQRITDNEKRKQDKADAKKRKREKDLADKAAKNQKKQKTRPEGQVQ